MHVDIKTTHYELTPEIESYLSEKLEDVTKLLDEEDTSTSAYVQLAKKDEQHQTGRIYTAKVNLHIAGGDFRATAREESMNAAIDEVKDELFKEVKRHKGRQRSMMRRGGARLKSMIRGFRR